MFYCQRLAPASVTMTVTPSHTRLSQLPLAACQTVNGSAKAVTTRCHPAVTLAYRDGSLARSGNAGLDKPQDCLRNEANGYVHR